MTNFVKWNMYYSMGWATKEQLRTVVGLGQITKEEFEVITGESY
jgi:uncharacterized XkdX family phage protein